jgi:hypothetical protein
VLTGRRASDRGAADLSTYLGGTMSFSLSWRRVAVACALLMAAAAAFAFRSSPDADAQEPPLSATFVFSSIPVTPSNGQASLGAGTGTNDGVLGIACTGAAPRGGTPRIPGQVVTQLGSTATLLRVIQYNGVMVTGNVLINCVIEVEVTPEGTRTVERLREAATAG